MSPMIEPALSGRALLDDIGKSCDGRVRLWRLGQAGFAIKADDTLVLIDLYLSDHCNFALAPPFDHRRQTRAPLNPAEIVDADAILCTHDHLDHLDPPTIRALGDSSRRARLLLPTSARGIAESLWWSRERIVDMEPGRRVGIGAFSVTAVPAAHEQLDRQPDGCYPYLGYILQANGFTIYHGGDTVGNPIVTETVAHHRPDLCLLPVNGRSTARKETGFAGTLHAEEAVAMTAAVGSSHLVPMHYDMFPQNTDPDWRERLVVPSGTVSVHVLEVGERMDLVEGLSPLRLP